MGTDSGPRGMGCTRASSPSRTPGGFPSSTLSRCMAWVREDSSTGTCDRLKLMEEHGLITHRFYSDHPPRAEYLLTDKGEELGMVVGALAVWGARHVHPETALVHTDCGEPVQMGYYCPHCGDRVGGTAVQLQQA